jgi:hypothetical protein
VLGLLQQWQSAKVGRLRCLVKEDQKGQHCEVKETFWEVHNLPIRSVGNHPLGQLPELLLCCRFAQSETAGFGCSKKTENGDSKGPETFGGLPSPHVLQCGYSFSGLPAGTAPRLPICKGGGLKKIRKGNRNKIERPLGIQASRFYGASTLPLSRALEMLHLQIPNAGDEVLDRRRSIGQQ